MADSSLPRGRGVKTILHLRRNEKQEIYLGWTMNTCRNDSLLMIRISA